MPFPMNQVLTMPHTVGELQHLCMCMQIEQLNAKVAELQAQSWQATNCRSELELLKAS